MIQNLIFGVYLLILDFLAASLKVKKNLQKTSLVILIRSKILTHFTKLHLYNIVKNIL